MSRVCELTGTKPQAGNKVSHSNIKTRTRWLPNLRTKRYRIEELGKTITLTLSAGAMRTIDKHGSIAKAVLAVKESTLSDQLKRVRRDLAKKFS